MKMPQEFIDAAVDSGLNYRMYSGRAMYGDKCIAFTGSDEEYKSFLHDLILDNIDNESNIEVIAKMIKNERQDSMGRNSVFYYPKFTAVYETEDDEYEEDETEEWNTQMKEQIHD